MIKVKTVDVKQAWRGEVEFDELVEAVNEIGEDRILHVTSYAIANGNRARYTIIYEDDD